jgi:hypothetical protein
MFILNGRGWTSNFFWSFILFFNFEKLEISIRFSVMLSFITLYFVIVLYILVIVTCILHFMEHFWCEKKLIVDKKRRFANFANYRETKKET